MALGEVTPSRFASPLRRSGDGLLLAIAGDGSGARGGWLVAHLGSDGLQVFDLPLPLLYLVPLGLDGSRLEAVWVETVDGEANSLLTGTIPLTAPEARQGRLLRSGGPLEVHHPVVDPAGLHVGFLAGPGGAARGWVLPLGPVAEAPPAPEAGSLGDDPVDAVLPVIGGSGPTSEWTSFGSDPSPWLTWHTLDGRAPRLLARVRVPHSLTPRSIRIGNTLVLAGTRFLGAEGPGRFSSVRTALAVLHPGCVDTRPSSP